MLDIPALKGVNVLSPRQPITAEDLAAAYHEAARYDDLVLAERMLEGKEVNFPILGDQVLPSIHIEPATEFYDYQAKYFRDDTRYHCPGLPAADEQRLREQVLKAFRVLGCSGWGRMDVFVGHDGQVSEMHWKAAPNEKGALQETQLRTWQWDTGLYMLPPGSWTKPSSPSSTQGNA